LFKATAGSFGLNGWVFFWIAFVFEFTGGFFFGLTGAFFFELTGDFLPAASFLAGFLAATLPFGLLLATAFILDFFAIAFLPFFVLDFCYSYYSYS